ncbi:MAG: heme-binding domain-containing protein [Bdellovibrionales bacterium]|nr:heme-binding domain-containing protein [Bdellovibrionales bacterium]
MAAKAAAVRRMGLRAAGLLLSVWLCASGSRAAYAAGEAPGPSWTTRLDLVQRRFEERVRPFLSSKCYDCHSSRSWTPWYSFLPGGAAGIEKERAEALARLDFTNGFPFGSPLAPIDQIEKLRDVVAGREMPPPWYWALTPGSTLTELEETALFEWATEAAEILREGRARKSKR